MALTTALELNGTYFTGLQQWTYKRIKLREEKIQLAV